MKPTARSESVNLTAIRPRGRVRALREVVFEAALAALSVVYGCVIIADRLIPGLEATGQLELLPPPFAVALGGLFIVGGVAVLTSFMCRSRNLGQLMIVERVGLSLLAGAWSAFGAGVLATSPRQVASWFAAAVVIAACATRWTVLRNEAHTIRSATRKRATDGDQLGEAVPDE